MGMIITTNEGCIFCGNHKNRENKMNRKIDELGRIVIPMEIRKKLDIQDNDTLNIEVKENSIVFTKNIDETNDKLTQLENRINEWKDDLENGKENIEGLDVFEEHTLIVLDNILGQIAEIRG